MSIVTVSLLCGCGSAPMGKGIERSRPFDLARLSVVDGRGRALPANILQKTINIPLSVKLGGVSLDGHCEAFELAQLFPDRGPRGSIQLPWLNATALVSGFSAIKLPAPSDKIFVCGGDERPNRVRFIADKTWLISSQTAEKRVGPTLKLPRRSPVLAMLPDGGILICGGFYRADKAVLSKDLEIYRPASDSVESGGKMQVGRLHPALVILGNGKVLIIGGERADEADQNEKIEQMNVVPASMTNRTTAELYDPTSGSSIMLGPVNVPESITWTAPLGDHEAIFAGMGQMLPGTAAVGQTVLIDASLPPPGNP